MKKQGVLAQTCSLCPGVMRTLDPGPADLSDLLAESQACEGACLTEREEAPGE